MSLELMHRPYAERCAGLENLLSQYGLTAPWTLCPETSNIKAAQEWLASWTEVVGVEGLMIKGRGQRYLPGVRGWHKIRRRDTTEAVIGAVTGTLHRPRTLLLARRRRGRRVRHLGGHRRRSVIGRRRRRRLAESGEYVGARYFLAGHGATHG